MGLIRRLLALAAVPMVVFSAQAMPAAAPPSVAVANPQAWPRARSPRAITDPATENRITRLLARMTLEQKVGQLIQADISTIKPEDLARYPLGSILAGGNSGPFGNERASAHDWHRMVEEYRAASLKPAANGIAIPILFGVDAVHGHSNLPGATIFPHNIGLGAARDPDLIERIGRATAAEVAGSGIEWTFAPTLAVPQDFRWGRTYEGYSSDPKLVADYAAAMVRGLQGPLRRGRPLGPLQIAATPKHFIADGGTFQGRDQGDSTADEASLIAIHGSGYPAAIEAGALTIMASFSSWHGIKIHGNHSLLTGVLKDRMGFQGLVVGDWNGHGQVAGCTVTNCPSALLAGIDLYMAPDSWKGLYETLLRQAKAGEIPIARIDDGVRRILRVKTKLGLMERRPAKRFEPARIGSPDHLAVAREAVAKSLVLLKNNGSVLPIRAGANVLVTGPGAESIAMQSGGWTVSWQGTDVRNEDFPNGQTIADALSAAVREAGGQVSVSPDGSFERKPDVAVVVFGERAYAEFLGDVPTLAFQPGDQRDLALLRRLNAQGIPVVSIFLSGRPMFVSPEINASDAFVAAWLPGTQAIGIADVIVAKRDRRPSRDFTGRLPFAWPADARSPVAAPLFERGYGLSYAAPEHLGPLSENPMMDLAAAIDVNRLMSAGQPSGPWTLTIADDAGGRTVMTSRASSMAGKLSMAPVDLTAQEDGRLFVWTGPARLSLDGPAADFARQLNNAFALRLELRVDQVSGPVRLGFASESLDIAPQLRRMPRGALATLQVPLRCFAEAGASVTSVGTPMMIDANSGTQIAIRSASIEAVGEDLACPSS